MPMSFPVEPFVKRKNYQPELPRSVKESSAVGDGLTDDTNSIVDAAYVVGDTGTILFPAGEYRVSVNTTVNCAAIFLYGASLKPDAGVTVTLNGPVDTAPGASIVAAGTAGSVVVNGPTSNGGGTLDVRTFGAVGDGVTDDTAAIKAALGAARPGDTVFLPAPSVGYLISPIRNPAGDGLPGGAQIHVPEGVTLAGAGYASVLLVDPTKFVQDGRHHIITFDSDATLRDFRLDGRKDEVNRTGLTSLQVYAIYAAKDGTTAGEVNRGLLHNVYVHNVLGINQESFGLMITRDCVENRFENCIAHDIEGSGIHVAGSIATTGDWKDGSLSDRTMVIDCVGYNNTYSGVSCFATRNVIVQGGDWFDNNVGGINLEWADEVDVTGAVMRGNGYGGLTTYAYANARVFACTLYGNNTRDDATFGGEFSFQPASWFTGSPAPSTATDRVVISGCDVRPDDGKNHVNIRGFTSTAVTSGFSIPRAIVIRQPDAAQWLINSQNSAPGGIGQWACVDIEGVPVIRPIAVGPLSLWLLGSGVSRASYSGTGNLSPDAVTFTGTVQFAEAISAFVLKAGRKYLIRVRAKVETADQSVWQLRLRDAVGNAFGRVVFPKDAATVDNWIEHAQCVTIPSGADYRFSLMQIDVSASTLFSVDYLEVYEIESPLASVNDGDTVTVRGDEGVSLVAGTDTKTQVFNTPLTAVRAVDLSATRTYNGASFKIVRTAAATGSDPLNVGTGPLKALAVGEWCEVTHNGSAWVLTAFGTL